MSKQVYEILTKATISKGCKKTINKYEIEIGNIDEILGCWMTKHEYTGYIEQGSAKIEGHYEIHLWYSFYNDSQLLKQTIQYSDMVDLNSRNSLKEKDEVVVECKHLPTCIKASVKHGKALLEIEKEMALKIVGETTILVESPKDEMIDINQNFIA